MKKFKSIIFVSAIALLLVGCNKEDEVVDPAQAGDPVDEQKVLYPAPFSGEQVEKELTNRPVLVTINNQVEARPQSGIASADVIYEMLAEGDVTRFLALFQSEIPEAVGPIRSARSYFIDLAKGLDAFYIAHGYSPEAKQMLAANVVDNINGMAYDGTLFYRSKDRVAPHNSYMLGENFDISMEKVGASTLYTKKVSYAFYDEQDSVKIGNAATKVKVKYSSMESFNSTYTFSTDSGTYERSNGNTVTTDLLTSEPVQISNVLMFEMQHSFVDSYGRRDIDISSGGKAYVAQQGTIREVQWENQDGLLVAVESDGSQVKLVPGLTWVHFLPTSPGITAGVSYE
jgi:hypothetical protein